MAERKIDKSRLGVDDRKLNNTSVEFIREDSPMVSVFNDHIVEGVTEEIQVVKETNGHHRPFLVLEVPELHAKVALYMTTSVSKNRMEMDNSMRGYHYFEAPFGLVNYISRSAITGYLDEGKVSVIDKYKYIFLTEDSFVERDSKAKDIEDFNIGMGLHARNAGRVEDLISRDLATKDFVKSVDSGAPELWAYRRKTHEPIIYNPSASYLILALNALEQYKNPKKNLSAEQLETMGEVAGEVADAYIRYLNYDKKLQNIELGNHELYAIYERIRLYQNLLPERTVENILDVRMYYTDETLEEDLEAVRADKSLTPKQKEQKISDLTEKYSYRNIYGDPIRDVETMDERIDLECKRARVDRSILPAVKDMLRGLIKEEQMVSSRLAEAGVSVRKFLESYDGGRGSWLLLGHPQDRRPSADPL